MDTYGWQGARRGASFPTITQPLEYSGLDDLDRPLIAARDAFPGWDIYRAAWGYLAVPGDSPVFMAVDTDGLVAKLRNYQEGQP